ncbi:MAG: hypothetical protein SWH61_10810 [Thermodesulfobacteriota bacterium]|nr:hypothetical protein [Thermodesulfobacteriota bacterium]
MIAENEIIMLVLGMGVYGFMVAHKQGLARIPYHRLFFNAYRILLAAWMLTVLEGFFLPSIFNFLEHLCYACGTGILSLWCYKLITPGNDI